VSEQITITLRDNTKHTFKHRGRPGGSYTINLSFEGSFAIVTDEYGKRTAFPESLIANIEEHQGY